MAVQGSNGEGLIEILADQEGIVELILQVNDQQLSVRVPDGSRPLSNRPMTNIPRNLPDGVVDAEVISESGNDRTRSPRRLPSARTQPRQTFPSDWTTGI